MFPSSRRVSALLLAGTLTPSASAAHTHLPTTSIWTLNLAESDFGGGPSMKSDTFVMVTDTEKRGRFLDHMVDGEGKTWKLSWSGPEDGTAHPLKGMDGATYSSNAATDVSVMTMPDGTTITCNFALSSNSKKYTNKCIARTKYGKQTNQTLVYDCAK